MICHLTVHTDKGRDENIVFSEFGSDWIADLPKHIWSIIFGTSALKNSTREL